MCVWRVFFSQNRRIGPGHPHPTSNNQSSNDETPTTMRTLARLSTSHDHQSSLADAQLAASQIWGFVLDCQCMATRKSGCLCEASVPTSLLRYQCKLAEGTKRLGYIYVTPVWQSIGYKFREQTAAGIQTSNTTSSSNSSVIALRHLYAARFAFWSCRHSSRGAAAV